MSFWSGLAAAGVAFALAIVALGQPVWEYERIDPPSQTHETWAFSTIGATNKVVNATSGVTTWRNYSYDALAGLTSGRAQPHVAKVFGDFQLLITLALIAGAGGLAAGAISKWKKVRGLYAGLAFLAPSALVLYAIFTIAFALPDAASQDVSGNIRDFTANLRTPTGSLVEAWGPQMGWYLPIGCGLAFAWASSDFWHLRPERKTTPVKAEATVRRVTPPSPQPLPPPPDAEPAVVETPEPQIEEVFVIGSNGLLIKHMSRTLMTDKDRDVVGSMISAISSFVREAFTERDGEVHEVSLGDHRFVMCNEAGLVVAVLVTSGQTEDIVHRLKHLLAVLRDRYGERLASWQGEPMEGIEDELGVLWDPYHLPPPPAV